MLGFAMHFSVIGDLFGAVAVIGDTVVGVWIPHEPEMFWRRQMYVDVFHELQGLYTHYKLTSATVQGEVCTKLLYSWTQTGQ